MELLDEFQEVSADLTRELSRVMMLNSSTPSPVDSLNNSLSSPVKEDQFLDYLFTTGNSTHADSFNYQEWTDSLWFLNATYNATFQSSLDYPNVTRTSLTYAPYERFMDESRHWVQRVLVPLVMCVGVFGNSVSMVVLTRKKMRSSTNNYLTALAISDFFYLIFVFSLSLQHHPDIKHPRHWFYWQYFRYGLWFTDASSSTSIWLTVTFTIERYIAISHPIKGKVLCTVSRAKKVVIVVYLLCWLLTATTPHEWVVVTQVSPKTKQPYLTLEFSSLGQDSTYRHTYYWFTAVTFILLPLCLLVVFNWFLIQAVRKSKFQRRKMTMVSERDHYSHQQEHKITVMLIAVVICALICQMPTAVLLLYSTVYEPPPKTKAFAIMRGLGNIFNLLNAINAAANFILYSAFSDKYRRTFLITFMPCLYHQQPQSHSFITSTDGRRYTNDSMSIRSVSRRVSKTNSTPSPMPMMGSPLGVKSGSLKENGVNVLDAKVTLQYSIGRNSNKRGRNLSPFDTYINMGDSNMNCKSPGYDSISRTKVGYSPSIRCRPDLQCFDEFIYIKPDFDSEKNHCQITKDNQYTNQKSPNHGKELDLPSVERGVTLNSISINSLGDNDPMLFKFIDDESVDLSRSSSPYTTGLSLPVFTYGGDTPSPEPTLGLCESPGSSLPAHSPALSPGSTGKSSDSSKETTILSPD